MTFRARYVLTFVVLGIAVLAAGACGSSQRREAYLSEDGVPYVRYQTVQHSTGVLSEERLVPFMEALDQAENDFGAPFKAPVTDPRRVFASYMHVRINVPESAYQFGQYPTVHIELVVDPDFQPDGSLDPTQRPGQATDANVVLEVKHPVDGLRPLDPTTPLLEVESRTVDTIYIHQFHDEGGRTKDARFYWLDGDTQYMLETPPVAGMRTREEMLALVDLIASQDVGAAGARGR